MDIKFTAAILLAKLSKLACKCIGRSGTTLSGKLAAQIDRDILKKLSKNFFVIMVTGTNGKTTTTKMVSDILNKNGVAHITNRSGANLYSGITSIFIESVNLSGKCPVSTALIEVDEATVDRVADSIHPDVLIVTNFFRDQLDRYGELTTVVNKVRSGIKKSPKTKLILNADDSLCASLGKDVENETVYYGVEPEATTGIEEKSVSEASYCIYCKAKYDYSYRVYGHLGGYQCSHCGYARPAAQVKCVKVDELMADGSKIQFQTEDQTYAFRIGAPGLYNVYNALAAFTCGNLLRYPIEKTMEAFSSYESCFGRMETIHVQNKNIRLILAKNPAGFNQILNYLSLDKNPINLSFLINDRTPDGNDISWLWDVEFEKVMLFDDRLENAFISGIRAEDMALRLKYAGVAAEKITVIKDYHKLIETGLAAIAEGGTFYIVANYTAMMDIRRMMKKRYRLKEFWK
jgi:UDP-N-acetylmuramyl tripeptide synthase